MAERSFHFSLGLAVRIVAVSTGIWLLVALVTFLQTWWSGVGPLAAASQMSPLVAAAQISLFEWSPWVLLSPLIVLLAAAVPITQRTWKWSAPLHFACSLGVAVAVNAVSSFVSWHLMASPGGGGAFMAMAPIEHPLPPRGGPQRDIVVAPPLIIGHAAAPLPPFPPDGGPPPGPIVHRPPISAIWFMSARLTLPIYWLIVVAVHAWRHHCVALEREGRAVRAEREVVRARLAALQSQLQPHFLFNSLNAISAFIAKRPAAAEGMVCALSDLLRAVLGMAERTEIALREELDFARRYLAVHRIRFEDALRVSWHIAPEAMDARVPTLLLQPLIENALDHGLAGSPGELEIRAVVRERRLVLGVTNRLNAPARGAAVPRAQPGTRLGLRNTRARLEALFGRDFRLELIEVPGGVRAEIELPLHISPA